MPTKRCAHFLEQKSGQNATFSAAFGVSEIVHESKCFFERGARSDFAKSARKKSTYKQKKKYVIYNYV